jgi:hypothetical protein
MVYAWPPGRRWVSAAAVAAARSRVSTKLRTVERWIKLNHRAPKRLV